MKVSIVALLLLFLLSEKGNAQTTVAEIPLSEFTFDSIFGGRKNDKENTYCLLGTGFFRAPRSKDSDSLIKAWIKKYPNAVVVPICSSGPTLVDYPNSKMTYCWVINSTDTLNNYLISNGCFPGGTMLRPKTFSEMSKKELDIFKMDKNAHDVTVYIDEKTYKNFISQIQTAEEYARREKLGVWSKKIEE